MQKNFGPSPANYKIVPTEKSGNKKKQAKINNASTESNHGSLVLER